MSLIKSIARKVLRPVLITACTPLITACPIHAGSGDNFGVQFPSFRHGALQTATTQPADIPDYKKHLGSAWHMPAQAASMLEYSLIQVAWEDEVALGPITSHVRTYFNKLVKISMSQ